MSLLAAASHRNDVRQTTGNPMQLQTQMSLDAYLPTLPMSYMHRMGFAVSAPHESRAPEALAGGHGHSVARIPQHAVAARITWASLLNLIISSNPRTRHMFLQGGTIRCDGAGCLTQYIAEQKNRGLLLVWKPLKSEPS